ncbi:Ig-like domain-containing protein [Streptomyces sp. NPDC046197]|uniref:Ig-like domain-containing protein n=1 Tax=Streptomyces sp. NPDC046197 TaxID=3154337 RepID=UPI003410F478
MRRVHSPHVWAGVSAAALTTVLIAASPAAAAGSSTHVTASPSATTVGSPVTLTATVTCASDPSGGLGVTFFDGSQVLDTVPVTTAGAATYRVAFGVPGTHTITAAYNGNGVCGASNGTTSVSVSPSPVPPPYQRPGWWNCGGLVSLLAGGGCPIGWRPGVLGAILG